MKKRVLIVEDEMIVAMDLQSILIDLGYDVPVLAASGEEAIVQAETSQPDLVLMDIHLRDQIDGIEAAQAIVTRLNIPVVYLTAYADSDTLRRACETSPYGYILKPFEARELRANLEIAFHKHQLEQLAREDRQWLLAVLNSMSEAVVASDRDGTLKFMNPVAEQLSGWPQAEAARHGIAEVFTFVDEATRNPVESPLITVLRGESSRPTDTLLRAKDGRETPVTDTTSPICDGRGEVAGAVMVFRDVTEQRRSQDQLQHDALHDALTDLPNRALFLDRLQQAVDRAERSPQFHFVVMLLDLDRFKLINDTLGHAVGDQLLQAVAPRLQTHLRSVDTVARLGGDEFAILLEDMADATAACTIASRILAEIQQPLVLSDHELRITSSLGIALSSTPYQQAADLLKAADMAMYRAKAQGRGGYQLFDATLQEQATRFLELEHDLRQAIAHSTLQVYYQPIIALSSGQMVSLEALVRWPHPTAVPAADLIALAEETGLVTSVDQWVLAEACRQFKIWQRQFKPPRWPLPWPPSPAPGTTCSHAFTLNVNLSSQQFAQPHLVDHMAQVLHQTGLSGHCLRLEVTESVLIDNAEAARTTLGQLKQMGLQICLDNFGTGYSALSYLHQFPIDQVKIDRAFIQNLDTDRDKQAIVQAILNLCHSLRMIVTAEGIETTAQAQILQDMGCEYGQGHLFAPPLRPTLVTQALSQPIPPFPQPSP